MARYRVPIIGDGKTPETAFRPDLPDGMNWAADIPTNPQGQPIAAECRCDVAEEVLADKVNGKAKFVIIDDADYLDVVILPHNAKIRRDAS